MRAWNDKILLRFDQANSRNYHLRGFVKRGKISAIFFSKGDTICDFLFDFLHTSPFWKGVVSQESGGVGGVGAGNSDHFSEGSKNNFDRVSAFASVSFRYKIKGLNSPEMTDSMRN